MRLVLFVEWTNKIILLVKLNPKQMQFLTANIYFIFIFKYFAKQGQIRACNMSTLRSTSN